MKKILIAIPYLYPFGEAYAARTRALCKLFQETGYEVDILCDKITPNFSGKEYGNIYSLEKDYQGLKKLFLLPRDYAKKMDSLLEEEHYSFLLSSSMFDRFGYILKVARKHRVKLILESCEWYDIKAFRHGRFDIRYFQFLWCFKNLFKKVDGVVAISRLLKKYYSEDGTKCVVIPGIHDVEKIDYRENLPKGEKLKLLFSGNIGGGKEMFSELLDAIYMLKTEGKTVELHIFGPSMEAVILNLDSEGKRAYKNIEDRIIFHGKIPQDKMTQACSQYDFGIFFRPDRRSSHAGFPTKLGEYLSAGTPVITNDTGDISLVMENGVNGYMLSTTADAEEIKTVLNVCIAQSQKERNNMRKAARATAIKRLDYHDYVEALKNFLDIL